MNDQAIADILDRLRNRFYGKYRGTVTEVDAGTMRIKAKVPAVLADKPSGWCMACVPYAGQAVGFAFLPEKGAGVWIEFEGGDVSYPIWTGCYWREGEPPAGAAAAVKAIVTLEHQFLLDDDTPSIKLADPNGNSLAMDSSGLTIACGSKHVAVSDSEVNINDGALELT